MGAHELINDALIQGAMRPTPGARGYGAVSPRLAPSRGVSLAKASDGVPSVTARPFPGDLPYGWLLDENDLDGMADWFAHVVGR